MTKPQVELLSPAGSLETLQAVAAAGADAVYCAGNRFGARAYANNLTQKELLQALEELHLHGKRLYLTVNTLLKREELEKELWDYISPLYCHGLDGVIVQDLGVLAFLRRNFPGMELHASTQMNLTGVYGARMLKEMGCCRSVPARELSLEEIRSIHEQVDIEIEGFVHGALCYCYSGQCLLSSMLGGRSGNRGRCAQPCRLPYRMGDGREKRLLSPKDLCAIELLPQIVKSGVCSLKIEGRMKQTEYAAGVTAIYREYLDRCLAHPGDYRVEASDLRRLEELGSRSGFTRGYYVQHNGSSMMSMERSAHSKADSSVPGKNRNPYPQTELKEKIKGNLMLSKDFPARLVLQWKGTEVAVEGACVQKAKSRPMSVPEIADRMKKTGGSGFVFEELQVDAEDGIFIPVGELNQLRREGLAALRRAALAKYSRKLPEMDGSSIAPAGECVVDVSSDAPAGNVADRGAEAAGQKPCLAVSALSLRQSRQAAAYAWVDCIYVDSGAFSSGREEQQLRELAQEVHGAGKRLYYQMPPVMRKGDTDWYEEHFSGLVDSGVDGCVAGNLEALAFLRKHLPKTLPIVADGSLYAANPQAVQELLGEGAARVTLPAEANQRELQSRGYPGGELLIYGYLPLMFSAQCVWKNTCGCRKDKGESQREFAFLTDRYGKEFPVRRQCRGCYNVIYNTAPLALFHQAKGVKALGAEAFRICLTMEDEAQTAQVMRWYEQAFLRGEKLCGEDYGIEFTNGHWKRGVE